MHFGRIIFMAIVASMFTTSGSLAQFDRDALYKKRDECTSGLAASCLIVGEALEKRNHGDDPPKALFFYQYACRLKAAEGCNKAGKYHADGIGTVQSYAISIIYYDRSCALGDGNGCTLKEIVQQERDAVNRLRTLEGRREQNVRQLCAASILAPPMDRDACSRACSSGDSDSCAALKRYR
jgi:TPR repeat protein